MTQALYQTASVHITADRPPGFLLGPFGWASGRVLVFLKENPELSSDLLHLSRIRMHLIALALAHLEGEPPQALGYILIRGSAGDILDSVLGRRPVGLKRVLRCLPDRVLEEANYRLLVQLLDDPTAAKMLHHAGSIDDSTVKIIENVPAELRSVVFAMQPWFRGMESLGDGLRCLVRRGGAASFEQLVSDLSSIRQPEQLIAKINAIVEALPLPDILPPFHVGNARRIDGTAEIRNLAKRWRNCLENYIWRVNGGDCAIYLWEHGGIQAACLSRRRARLGWFLDEVQGPRNTDIEPEHRECIVQAFDGAGMPLHQKIGTIEDIVDMAGVRGLRRRARRPAPQLGEADDEILQGIA